MNVVDTTAPKIILPANPTFQATSLTNNTVPLGNAIQLQTLAITITNNASKTFQIGKTTVLWTAKDTSGNISNATQTVNVVDTAAPNLTPPQM